MNQPERRVCAGCGQRIPPSAKLAAETKDPAAPELCLQCRIRIAQAGKRS